MSQSAIDNVVGKVTEEVKTEIISILDSGLKEAETIVSNATKESEDELARLELESTRNISSNSMQVLGAAEIEARDKSLRLLEDKMNQVFKSTLKNLKTNKPNGYDKFLNNSLSEGIKSIGGDEFILYYTKSDKDRITKLSSQFSEKNNCSIVLSDDFLSASGGIKISNKDGDVVVVNTFEARLERTKPELRKLLADKFMKK